MARFALQGPDFLFKLIERLQIDALQRRPDGVARQPADRGESSHAATDLLRATHRGLGRWLGRLKVAVGSQALILTDRAGDPAIQPESQRATFSRLLQENDGPKVCASILATHPLSMTLPSHSDRASKQLPFTLPLVSWSHAHRAAHEEFGPPRRKHQKGCGKRAVVCRKEVVESRGRKPHFPGQAGNAQEILTRCKTPPKRHYTMRPAQPGCARRARNTPIQAPPPRRA